MTPSRPYLIRAIYEWIADNNFSPHVVIDATMKGVVVPSEHVKDGSIVLNVSAAAVKDLRVGNDAIEFKARFSGAVRHIYAPILAVQGIYAKENGRGMLFNEEDGDGGNDGAPPTRTHQAHDRKTRQA